MTKLKNSNCDKTQKLKLWQNSKWDKTPKSNWDKTENANCEKKKLKKVNLWQNSKTPIVIEVIMKLLAIVPIVTSFS